VADDKDDPGFIGGVGKQLGKWSDEAADWAGKQWKGFGDAAGDEVEDIEDYVDDLLGDEDDEESAEAGSKKAEKESRFIEQCFLTHELYNLSRENEQFRKNGYRNFVSLKAEPWQIINTLSAQKDLTEIFKIKPHQIAYLVPKIRLYKVVCREGEETAIEFPFKTNWNLESINALTREGKSLGSGVGIKDVRVKWLGTTDADVNRSIEVELELFAQTVGDLFHEEEVDGVNISVSDMINYKRKTHASTSPKNEIILDNAFRVKLVLGWAFPDNLPADLFPKPLAEAIKRTRISLDLQLKRHGLSFGQDGTVNLSVEYVSRLDALLGLFSADIIGELGPIYETLKNLAGSLGSLNAASKARKNQTQRALRKLKGDSAASQEAGNQALVKIINDLKTDVGEDGKRRNDDLLQKYQAVLAAESLEERITSLESVYEGEEELVEGVNQALKNHINIAKREEARELTEKYNKVINSLHQDSQGQGHLYYIDVSEEDVGIFEGRQFFREDVLASFAENLDYDGPNLLKGKPQVLIDAEKTTEDIVKERLDGEEDFSFGDAGRGFGKWVGDRASDLAGWWHDDTGGEKNKTPGPYQLENGNYRIIFFYLGSLLEIAYDIAKENHEKKLAGQKEKFVETGKFSDESCAERYLTHNFFEDLIPIVGPLVISPRKKIKNPGQVDLDDLDPPQRILTTLADVPISLKAFLEWWNRKVVKGYKKNYPLRTFINGILREIAQPVMSSEGCIGPGSRSLGVVRIETIQTPSAKDNKPRIRSSGRADLTSIKEIEFVNPESPDSFRRKQFLHQVFYVDDPQPNYIEFAASEEDDAKRGIYHLRLGVDSGIVKEINFERADIPYFVESQILDENDKELKFVREVYNAHIILVGNTIFKPGVRVYIDPALPTMGSVLNKNSPARKIGLGGLYLIVEAEYIYSENGFETHLKAIWQANPGNQPRPVSEEREERSTLAGTKPAQTIIATAPSNFSNSAPLIRLPTSLERSKT
jgi:hypothetical protein